MQIRRRETVYRYNLIISDATPIHVLRRRR